MQITVTGPSAQGVGQIKPGWKREPSANPPVLARQPLADAFIRQPRFSANALLPLIKLKQELAKGSHTISTGRRKAIQQMLNNLIEKGSNFPELGNKMVRLLMLLPATDDHWKAVAKEINTQLKDGETLSLKSLTTVPLQGKQDDIQSWLGELETVIKESNEAQELALPFLKMSFQYGYKELSATRRKRMEELLNQFETTAFTVDETTPQAMRLFATMPVDDSVWLNLLAPMQALVLDAKNKEALRASRLVPPELQKQIPFKTYHSLSETKLNAIAQKLVAHLTKAMKSTKLEPYQMVRSTEHLADLAVQEMDGKLKRDCDNNVKDPDFTLSLERTETDDDDESADDTGLMYLNIDYYGKVADGEEDPYCEFYIEDINRDVFKYTAYDTEIVKPVKSLMQALAKKANLPAVK